MNVTCRHGLAQGKALPQFAAKLQQVLHLGFFLDAFCHHSHAEAVRHVDHRLENDAATALQAIACDKTAIHFQRVESEFAQAGQI